MSKYYILSLEFTYNEKSDFIKKFCLHRSYNELHIEKIFTIDNIFEYVKSIFKFLSFFHVLHIISIENIFL